MQAMRLIDNLKWRYATKKYDPSKKVSQQDINYIKEAVKLTASSYGMQPYQVLEITDPVLRQELKPLSWDQSQVTDASHLFVFCNRTDVSDQDIDRSMEMRAQLSQVSIEVLSRYGDLVKRKLAEKSEVEMFHWTAKQTYMALSNALMACAELQIDSTPMEGFEPEAYNLKLGLTQKGLNASVLLAVGYRHAEDKAQHNKKIRKPIDSVFVEV